MQNQNNLTQQEQLGVLLKQQCKTLLLVMYITCVGVAGFSILGIISSQKLQNDYSYYTGIQATIIAFCSLTLLSLLFLIYVMTSTATKQCARILTQIAFFISSAGAAGVMLSSILISAVSIYCGYYIGHDGDADGLYITSYFEVNSNYPTCYAMENNNLSVQSQIYSYSLLIILDYCRLMSTDIQSCSSLSSLVVEDWSSMFSLQLTALIGLGVLYIVMTAIFTLIGIRYKKIQDQLKKSALVQATYYNAQYQYQYQQQQQIITSTNTNQIIQGQYPQQQQSQQQHLYQPPQQYQAINDNNQNVVVGQPII